MQAFANVATAPVRRTTQGGGKTYWEFRAAESAKNEDKEGATWYTVRVFQQDDPGFAKGDFIRVVGKLKQDVFMSRDGKPMGVLVVMCYEAKRYEKARQNSSDGSAVSSTDPGKAQRNPASMNPAEEMVVEPTAPALREQAEDVDERWLTLVQ